MIYQKLVETRKRLILSADDLNHAPEINDEIAIALDAGVLTSISVIANRPLPSSAETIIARKGNVSLGLHFNLSRYRPCSDSQNVRTLTANSRFELGDNVNAFLARVMMFREEEVALELENQILQFEDYFGVTPSYLDSHHYVHSIQPVMKAFRDTCISRGIPMRRAERRGCEVVFYYPTGGASL